MDGITPDCQGEAGCLIPPLMPEGRRALELRGQIVRLKDLVDADTVLRMHGADLDDLELLALIEDELKAGASNAARGEEET